MWSMVFPLFGTAVERETADRGTEDVKEIVVVDVQMAEDSEVEPGRYGRMERTVQAIAIANGLCKKTVKSQPEFLQGTGRDLQELIRRRGRACLAEEV